MTNRHEIKTYNDILRAVTSENVEAFLVDLTSALKVWVGTRAIIEATAPETLDMTIDTAKFTWIDDGKHDAKINIEFVKEKV